MRIFIVFIIIFSFTFANVAEAKFPDDLPGPKVMPDSPFYFLKIWYEKFILFFTFDAVKKADKYKTFAEKRAYEIKEMLAKGKNDLVKKLKDAYKSSLNKAKEKLEKAINKAVEQKRQELKQELERKLDEIKLRLIESINL